MSVLWSSFICLGCPLPTFGSYILEPHQDGEPLFNWSRRDASKPVPEDEAKLERSTREFIAAVLRAPISTQTQDQYISQIINNFQIGCVQEFPKTKSALRELKNIERLFVADALEPRISKRRALHFYFSTASLFVSASAGLFLRSGVPNWLPIDHSIVADYCFVWAASMAAIVVNDAIIPSFKDINTFWQQERMLSEPVIRVVATGFVSEAISIGLSAGAIDIKIGTLQSSKVDSLAIVALFVGFTSGLISSDLIKLIIVKTKKALDT